MSGRNPMWPMGGIQLIDAEAVGDPYEDWSQVRSPSRAIRRRKQGHPQRIVTRYRPNGKAVHDKARNIIYVHPLDRMKIERILRETRP